VPERSGNFVQSGFTLTAASEGIGPSGTFSQTGGTNSVAGNVALTAAYNLTGDGLLSAGSLSVDEVALSPGVFTAGTFKQSGGTSDLGGLVVDCRRIVRGLWSRRRWRSHR
jgi:hypothetical protein